VLVGTAFTRHRRAPLSIVYGRLSAACAAI
jgi:hypothetical protein